MLLYRTGPLTRATRFSLSIPLILFSFLPWGWSSEQEEKEVFLQEHFLEETLDLELGNSCTNQRSVPAGTLWKTL